jgi:hypothetical protein
MLRLGTCVLLLCLVTVLGGVGPQVARGAAVPCATKRLYGQRLGIFLVDGNLSCAAVRRIVRGACRDGRRWSCTSLRAPDPLLIWYRTRERFKASFSVVIEARRPPCSASHVTAGAWRKAGGRGFPTRRQVLADDLLRCHQLEGMTRREVTRLLGPADEGDPHQLAWDVGPERDSVIRIDDEFFAVRFDRHNRFRAASFFQG